MINVVDVPEPGAVQDPFELGLLLPIPGIENNTILMEDRDGNEVQHLTATSVGFKAGGRTAFRDQKLKIDLFITDARFGLACSKYDKVRLMGGGWMIWGATTEVLFNSVSKARAKIRSRGKMLVGHVRYPWIQRVGSSAKTGRGSKETLVFDTKAGQGGQMRLTLTLPNNIEAARVAAEVARRAAIYRLASEEVSGDSRARLEQLATSNPPLGTQDGEIRFYDFPEARWVSEESAKLAPAART